MLSRKYIHLYCHHTELPLNRDLTYELAPMSRRFAMKRSQGLKKLPEMFGAASFIKFLCATDGKPLKFFFNFFFCCTIRFCWQQRKQTLEIWKAAAPNKTLSYKFPNGKPAADRAAFSSNINLWLWLTHRAATRTTLCDLRELPSSKNQF